jgi:hypothetical protein
MQQLVPNPDNEPFRMIIGGPGGTGKSHIYDALRSFYDELGILAELNFTAPTGVSASNIRGSTIHHEAALRVKTSALTKSNSASLASLIERFEPTRTLVIDEFFFLGCKDFEKLSRHINIARACSDDPFGNLDLILSGDEYQLSAPLATPLFDHRHVSLHKNSSSLQPLNDTVRQNVIAIKNYRTIQTVVVLDQIVRQRHPRFVELLNRLRHGTCTISGDDNDLDFLCPFRLHAPNSLVDPNDTSVSRWIYEPHNAAPLITYTNNVRNTHNWLMTKVFASATNQDFGIYYSSNTMGRGKNKVVLRGQNAEDAWNTPIKSHAQDLSGRLPLAIGIPVFVVDNMAVELGLANGSGGVLVNINYELRENRRYAISAEVDIPTYTAPHPDAEFPHRILLPAITKPMQFTKGQSKKLYTAQRHQLPLIGGFSYTAHNSQSRSLNAATIHLESSASAAASYVMLSRLKCDERTLPRLAILGEVNVKDITNHAPQEVRNEEKRLKKLAAKTLEQAKQDLDWYLKSTGDNLD